MQTYLLSELHAVSAIVQSAVPKVPSAVTLTRRRRNKSRLSPTELSRRRSSVVWRRST